MKEQGKKLRKTLALYVRGLNKSKFKHFIVASP